MSRVTRNIVITLEMDAWVKEHGINLSKFVQRAIQAQMGDERIPPMNMVWKFRMCGSCEKRHTPENCGGCVSPDPTKYEGTKEKSGG